MKRLLFLLCVLGAGLNVALGCTSMIVSGAYTADGRPLMWKHRDTGATNNFLARVEPRDGRHGYVGLFNGGDSLLAEAWMGMNDAGFSIMNTASYNLAPDTAKYVDQEGAVMSLALQECATVDDFERMLAGLPKPMGVQANFGVIDGRGGAAYFETDDHGWTRYDVGDSLLVRTNFSVSGREGEGMGYIRYATALHLSEEPMKSRSFTPLTFTEDMSRSFYHGLMGRDMYGDDYVVNQDFIPRDISTSSLVVVGVKPGDDPSGIRMWGALGYPPCSAGRWISLEEIPDGFGPDGEWESVACREAMDLRKTLWPFTGGSGKKYIDLKKLRAISERKHREAVASYGERH